MTKDSNPWDEDADPSKLDLSMLVPPTKAEIEKCKQEDEQYNKDLRTRAKTQEELTVGLECVVESVDFYQRTGRATSKKARYGGPPVASHETGYFLHTELSVKSDSLVQKLEFKGWPPLEAGDTIKAYIMKGKEEPEKLSFGSYHDPYQEPKTHLVDRPYRAVEQPSKIEKLRDGKVVATYHNK